MFKIKLSYRNESWQGTGRTIYIPKDEVATQSAARDAVFELIKSDWKIISVEMVQGAVENLKNG